jgi:DNA-binding NtrC family response regulator
MDELRREFERYRGDGSVGTGRDAILGHVGKGGDIVLSTGVDVVGREAARYDYVTEVPAYAPGQSRAADPEESGPEPAAFVFQPGMTIEEMEREAIAGALQHVHGNRRKAAELLGIGERTLYRKISKYGLES